MAAIEKAGGRLIVMASRALARVAKSPADYERVYDRVLGQAQEPVIIHWLGEMFDPALAGYWGSADHMAAMQTAVAHHQRARRQGRRRQDLAARQGEGDRHAPPAGQGRAHVYGRRLQLRRADRRRRARATATPCSASSTPSRRPPPPRSRRSPPATAARFDDILAPTVPLSRHIFKAPTRFYKTGVVFMAYLNGLQDHFVMVGGQQSARSLAAPGRAVPPRRPRRPAARSRHGAPPHGARAGRARDRLMRDSRGRPLRTSRSTRRRCASSSPCRPSSRPAPRRGIGAICPWRDQVHAAGLAARRQADRRTPASRSPAIAAAASSRLPMPPACARRWRTTARPSTRPRRSARPAWCWWWARCRARSTGKPAHKDIGLARAQVLDGIAATLEYAQQRRHAARHRAAASHAGRRPRLHQHAGACARHLRRARSRPHRRARRRARRLPLLVGPQAREPDRARRRASACSPTTSATGWCRRAISSTTAA